MIKTITFKAAGIKYTVKETFLKVCSNPEEESYFDLSVVFQIYKYLHNESGPAVISYSTKGDYWLYYINGKELSKQEWSKQCEELKFHNKIEEIINNDT